MLERYGTYFKEKQENLYIQKVIHMSKSPLKLTKAENLIMGAFFGKVL
jgi:hypothetical protein